MPCPPPSWGRVLCAIKSLKNGLPQYFAQYFLETSTNAKKKKSPKMLYFQGFSMALHPNFDTIAVKVHFGANGCIRVQFVLVIPFLAAMSMPSDGIHSQSGRVFCITNPASLSQRDCFASESFVPVICGHISLTVLYYAPFPS